jgi:RNA-directed DNA polymerase
MSSEVATEATTAPPSIEDWTTIPWRKLEAYVFRLQKRIFQAQRRGNVRAVHSLQRLVMKSRAARTLAVRRVTQDNRGKKTAGVDGVKAVGPLVRLLYVDRLRHPATIKARPVRRVLIPKPGKPHEFRPLGIPVLLDRAHQALVKLALEPQWESRFEAHSYGFRPGRSCHDALAAIYLGIRQQPKYVLDADIRGCFDNIAFQPLLTKLDTFPRLRQTIKAWLKAGVLYDGVLSATTTGVPQGGTISPLLCNVALHGMEQVAATALPPKRGRPRLIRYADDLVVLHPEVEGVAAAQHALSVWLAEIGLEFKPSKTRITHTLHEHQGQVGFDFLGCTIRQFPVGKTRTGHTTSGQPLGFTTRITPSKEAIKRHTADLGTVIRHHRTVSQEELIGLLSPKIRGWAAYYRAVVARAAYATCDFHLYQQLRRWAFRRHPTKGRRWIVHRYWRRSAHRRWHFATATGVRLRYHTDTTIHRHVQVRGTASPFDGNLTYWAQRRQMHPQTGATLGRLLARQGGRCAYCGLLLTLDDLVEIDHVQPVVLTGGRPPLDRQALHRHCHDQKTAQDGSNDARRRRGVHDKDPLTEEPDEANVSRPVLNGGEGR